MKSGSIQQIVVYAILLLLLALQSYRLKAEKTRWSQEDSVPQSISALVRESIGSTITDSVLPTISGEGGIVSIPDPTKTTVVILFTSSDCVNCFTEVPLRNMLDDMDASIKAFAIYSGGIKAAGKSFTAAQNIQLPVLFDEHGSFFNQFGLYGSPFTPVKVIIDSTGKVKDISRSFYADTTRWLAYQDAVAYLAMR